MKTLNFWKRNLKSIFTTGKSVSFFKHYISKNEFIYLYESSKTDHAEFVRNFQTYFCGCYGFEAIDPHDIYKFGITDFKLFNEGETYKFVVTLTRPGLLIGKGGRTIDGLKDFLSYGDRDVSVHLIENKMWY